MASTITNSASPWASYSWYDAVKSVFADIPEYIWGSIIGVESGGNPRAVGDAGKSYGLFQLFTSGGLGDVYRDDPTRLFDPERNARIAAEAMRPHYEAGKRQGLGGWALLEYVASHAGWPLTTGTLPDDYRTKLYRQYALNYSGGIASPFPNGSGVKIPIQPTLHQVVGNTVFHQLDAIERNESGGIAGTIRRIAVQVMLVLLGLILIGVGLVATVGLNGSSKIVANLATKSSTDTEG